MTDSDDDDGCFTCCCSPCIGLCYLLCLRSMKVSTRLKIVWFWMISISLFSGLYIRYNLYSTDTISITSYDMMPVQKMSTFFCQGVTVRAESDSIPLAVYRLNNKPHINYTNTVYNSSLTFPLLVNTMKLIHYYLMAGSSITLLFCSKESVALTVIESTEKYENYLSTKDYIKYTDDFLTIHSGCRSATFDIHSTNRYYFLIAQNWRSSSMYLRVILNKTSYKVHGNNSHLEDISWEVFVPLNFQSTETIIYQPVLENYQELTVTTQCEPKNYLYVGLFLGGFLSLGLILSYFVKCLSKDPPVPNPPPSSTEPPENANENASPNNLFIAEPTPTPQIHPTAPPLLEDESSTPWVPESHPLPSCPPPAYDSLFANTVDNGPPPYFDTAIELNKK